jgi:uncharacterized protein YjbJ (UPF0337 family)
MSSGRDEGVEGTIEGLKGKAKEVAGGLSGNRSLAREGEAQQEKASAQRKAAHKEAEAEVARAQAARYEAEQRGHQR